MSKTLTPYKEWTRLRLLHYLYRQPEYEDREGIKQELFRRGQESSEALNAPPAPAPSPAGEPEQLPAVDELEVTLEDEETAHQETLQMLEIAKARLPETTQDCTILFRQCKHGHGWLTVKNWVQHPCPTCMLQAGERALQQIAVHDSIDKSWCRERAKQALHTLSDIRSKECQNTSTKDTSK